MTTVFSKSKMQEECVIQAVFLQPLMIKRKIANLVADLKEMTPTAKAMVVLCILLVIGILLRWDATIEGIKRGFGFFGID